MPTVLVVDDDDGIREALYMLFTSEGYCVPVAPNGHRALELLQTSLGSAVVLFDFLMPAGNGLDLLRGVAADAALQRRFTYICMAARDRSRLPAEFNELVDRMQVRFVEKPFDLDELLHVVHAAEQDLPDADCALST